MHHRRVPGLTRAMIAVAVLAASIGAGVHLAAPRADAIANGTAVPAGAYRFSVQLTMTDVPRPDGSRDNSACSAALIAPAWVITARHCFHDVNRVPVSGPVPYPTTATLGRTDLNAAGGHVVAVVWVIASPTNDIALARLASAVTDVPVLPLSWTAPRAGELLRMTGWGATSSVNPAPVTQLRTGQFRVSSVAASTIGVTGAAPAANTSACAHDSGAPYFRELPGGRAVLVSVESTGPACPHAGVETTARVDTVRLWILRMISPR